MDNATMSPGRCFVDGCDSYKYEGKISFFSAPKDPDDRKIWNNLLKTKNLEPSHYLCEKHFNPNDISKGLFANQVTVPNKITKGDAPSLPAIKQESPEFVAGETEYENKFDITLSDTKIEPEYVNIVNDVNPLKIEEIPNLTEGEIKLETDMDDFYGGNFFDELFENKCIFGLTQYWGIHSCEPKARPPRPCMVLLVNTKKPRSIIFSQMNTRDGFPVYEKQVIINEQLEITYFVAQTMVDLGLPKTCGSLEELCNAINKFAELILCRGGPSCDEYKEIVTNCAYKDTSSRTWRHKNCMFFTQEEMQPCLFCQALPKYFKTALRKQKKLKIVEAEMGSDDRELYSIVTDDIPKRKVK